MYVGGSRYVPEGGVDGVLVGGDWKGTELEHVSFRFGNGGDGGGSVVCERCARLEGSGGGGGPDCVGDGVGGGIRGGGCWEEAHQEEEGAKHWGVDEWDGAWGCCVQRRERVRERVRELWIC